MAHFFYKTNKILSERLRMLRILLVLVILYVYYVYHHEYDRNNLITNVLIMTYMFCTMVQVQGTYNNKHGT